MILRVFHNEFDLPVNVLIWCFLSTFCPSIFFALYAPTNGWVPNNVK